MGAGVGKVINKGDASVVFNVFSLKDLTKIIIPHFTAYPLITQKQALIFKSIIELMNKGEHLTKEGINKILSLKASMNLGLPDSLKAAFPSVSAVIRPKIKAPKNINPYWMAGFTSGEGCFYISVQKSKTHKTGYGVTLHFIITQNIRDIELLKTFIKFFDCGRIKSNSNQSRVNFVVTKSGDLTNKIIPFFNLYQIQGVKSADFADFCKAAELIKHKAHLTSSGLKEINTLKSQMNTKRDPSLLSNTPGEGESSPSNIQEQEDPPQRGREEGKSESSPGGRLPVLDQL